MLGGRGAADPWNHNMLGGRGGAADSGSCNYAFRMTNWNAIEKCDLCKLLACQSLGTSCRNIVERISTSGTIAFWDYQQTSWTSSEHNLECSQTTYPGLARVYFWVFVQGSKIWILDTKLTATAATFAKTLAAWRLRDPKPMEDVPDQDFAPNWVNEVWSLNCILLMQTILGCNVHRPHIYFFTDSPVWYIYIYIYIFGF